MEEKTEETISSEKSKLRININPKIYPLDVVYGAAYIMTEHSFVKIDGDPEKEIIVTIQKRKGGQDLAELEGLFNNELLNYATHKIKSAEALMFRNIILRKILSVNVEYENKPEQKTIQ